MQHRATRISLGFFSICISQESKLLNYFAIMIREYPKVRSRDGIKAEEFLKRASTVGFFEFAA
jgi:hypothetical protein